MNRGFLTIAQNGQHDYVRMAYALAMSLKLSQSKYDKLSVIVNKNEEIPEKYLQLFDKVIYVEKPDSTWLVDNKWRYFELTPYDETIVLDTDMLFFNDISLWWDCMLYDIEFTSHVVNYIGKTITSDYYRRTFTKSKLPNLYTGLFYFKKTKMVEDYFKLVKEIFFNWETFYNRFLKDPPKLLSGDVSYSLAAKIMFERTWASHLTFVHMRSRLQDETMVDDWNKYLTSFFTRTGDQITLKVNNFAQMYPFHYIKKNFLNDEAIELYEHTLRIL